MGQAKWGAVKKEEKKKATQVSNWIFGSCGKISAFFLSRF
jgi:hypothetical protein